VKKRASVRLRVYWGDIPAIGPGKIALLEAIIAQGSIRAAAKDLEMSYNRAWLLIHEMNDCFKSPVVESVAGGAKGGGAHVTPLGLQLIEEYRAIEQAADKINQPKIQKLIALLKP
jgi:molybdate transport system regulatory protein